MAFSFFICASPLADGRALPWPRPLAYNASDFELLRRVVAAYVAAGRTFELSDFSEWQAYYTPANVTKILLCCGRAPVNMDEPDLNRGWAHASEEGREAMRQAHRDYLLGSLYYMANDESVNNYTRYAIGRWGLCADEYVGFVNNLPPQIYVRVSNRLRGEALLTQNNLSDTRVDGIAVGHWGFDQHTESRRVVADPRNASRLVVANEGYFRIDDQLYDVPFGVMLPRRGEADNLLVPVAISATSVAYASTRIEQMFVDTGAAAGVAAALALEAAAARGGSSGAALACPALGFALQDSNVSAVQASLVELYQQRIHSGEGR